MLAFMFFPDWAQRYGSAAVDGPDRDMSGDWS